MELLSVLDDVIVVIVIVAVVVEAALLLTLLPLVLLTALLRVVHLKRGQRRVKSMDGTSEWMNE